MNDRRWLSVREAASRLNIHKITMYKLAAKGQVPAARLGGRLLIDWKRLEDRLEAQIEGKQ